MSRSTPRNTSLRRRPSRTVPALLVSALMLLAGVGLSWVSISRLAQGVWPAFFRGPRTWLGDLSWDSPSTWAIGAGLVLIGLILLLAALIPGQYNALRIDAPESHSESAQRSTRRDYVLTRGGLAKLAGARADQVDGISAVSASATPRRVNLSVSTPLRETRQLQARIVEAVEDRINSLGLSKPVRVNVSVRTEDH